MEWTDREQLDELLRVLQLVLGADLTGVYLFGSAVLGGLRTRSDLDVLAVVERTATPIQRGQLVASLLPLSRRTVDGRRQRSLELTLVVERDIKPWRYPPRTDFQYGDWLRPDLEAGDVDVASKGIDPDLTVLLANVIHESVALAGPPAATVLPHVPEADVGRAMLDCIDPLLADLETDTTNVLLTLARVACTLRTREIRSKDAAAEWALQRLLPTERPALEHATAVYRDAEPEEWEGRAWRVTAEALLQAISADPARWTAAGEPAVPPRDGGGGI